MEALLERCDLDVLFHALGRHGAALLRIAAGRIFRAARSAFVNGNGDFGSPMPGGLPFHAAALAQVAGNELGRDTTRQLSLGRRAFGRLVVFHSPGEVFALWTRHGLIIRLGGCWFGILPVQFQQPTRARALGGLEILRLQLARQTGEQGQNDDTPAQPMQPVTA